MKFARRVSWETISNQLSCRLEELRRKGTLVLDLTESNPTRCGFFYPDKEILAAFQNRGNLSYAPDPLGLLSAREAVCAYYRDRGVALCADQIVLTSSTSEAYSFLFRLLGDPGDEIVFPRPSYPLFKYLADLNDLIMKWYPLHYVQGRWNIDVTALDHLMSERTKAILCVSPNNPTGSTLNDYDVQAINKIAQAHNCPIICDEVFGDYLLDEQKKFVSLAANKEVLTFTLGGLSKAFAMPQMKLSWIVMNGPAKEVDAARARLEIIADAYLSVNTPVQNALPQWMPYLAQIQSMILTRIRSNYMMLKRLMADCSFVDVLPVEGGWYAVIRIRHDADEESLVLRLLEQEHVFIHPGYFFDFEDDGAHLVVSLLTEPERFQTGIERLREYGEKHKDAA